MRTPFKISFKKKIKDNSDRNILEDFKINFKNTYCDYIKIIGQQELIVKNDFFRLKPDLNFNLWAGIGRAEIAIEEDKIHNVKTIKYSIDFTRLTLIHIISISMFIISELDFFLENLFIYVIIIIISLVTHLITFLRHRLIFNRTIITAMKNQIPIIE